MEALILSEAILAQARRWRDEACSLDISDNEPRSIGQATFVSPITGHTTPVVLLVGHFGERGKPRGFITCRLRSLTGDDLGEGFTILLNAPTVCSRPNLVIHVLLHEIIHALDPLFLDDLKMQKSLQPDDWIQRLHEVDPIV